MSDKPVSLTPAPEGHADWLIDLKGRIHTAQQAVGQLPWGHNLVLLTRLKDPQQRLAYAQSAIEHGCSRNVLQSRPSQKCLTREPYQPIIPPAMH